MVEILQGTTPSIELTLPSTVDVRDLSALRVDIYQGSLVKTRTFDDVFIDDETNALYIVLSEEDTLEFSAGVINVDIRYKLKGSDNIFGGEPYPIKLNRIGVAVPFDSDVSVEV